MPPATASAPGIVAAMVEPSADIATFPHDAIGAFVASDQLWPASLEIYIPPYSGTAASSFPSYEEATDSHTLLGPSVRFHNNPEFVEV